MIGFISSALSGQSRASLAVVTYLSAYDSGCVARYLLWKREIPAKYPDLGDTMEATCPSGEKLTGRFEDGRPIEVTTDEG